MKCVDNIDIEDHQCQPKCEGLFITSHAEHEKNPALNPFISRLSNEYSDYKGNFHFPNSLKGRIKKH